MNSQTDAARHDTRRRILDIAEQLLLTRGFNGFSYQQISGELGVRNAAIHYHFPHKTDLGVALIERYRRRLKRYIDSGRAAPADVGRELERYFALAESYFRHDRQVCPSGMLSTEYETLPQPMREQSAAFVAEMRDWSVAIAGAGRAAGLFSFAGDPRDMGMLMVAALQGGLQLARIDAGWLEAVRRQITLLLGAGGPQDQRE